VTDEQQSAAPAYGPFGILAQTFTAPKLCD
jgi:hypothetical protein